MHLFKRLYSSVQRYFQASLYGRLVPYLRPYKLLMAVVVLILLVQIGLNLLEPILLIKVLIDNGLKKEPLPEWLLRVLPFLDGGGVPVVIFAVVGGLSVRLIRNALDILGDYLKSWINDGMTLAFQANLFNHLQRLSFSYHDQTSVGDSLYRLHNDTGFISTHLWGNFRHLLTSTLTLLWTFAIVLYYAWELALLAVAIAPLLYGSAWFYGRYFKAKSKRVKKLESESESVLQEVLSCLRVVKAFGQEDREQRRFEGKAWTALFARLRLSLEQSVFSSSLGFTMEVIRCLILLVGGLHVFWGQLELGTLLLIVAYVSDIHGPLEEIGHTLTDMQLSMASAERVIEVLDTEPEVKDRPGAKTLDWVRGALTFEDVSFAYTAGRPVLRDINFSVRPGEVVAIVGPTGAGKTTLANLIARFYDPGKGRVSLDGFDLRDLTVQTLRDNIALVIQEPILFSTSLRENIAYGRPSATLDEVVEAAKAANAHDFIAALPKGYESQVGERGVRLSGGERQRVAVARAFLKNSPVLILDEPTSSVDSRTELMILEALDRLMAGRTAFIIAHRLSTIRRADQILVIDHGRIVESGTHDTLLEQGGLYAQLWRIQSRGLRRDKEEVPV